MTKRSRPISQTEDPALRLRREQGRQRQRAYRERKRVQRPTQTPSTREQLQQGEQIIEFGSSQEEIAPTHLALGLRLQGLTLGQDSADAAAQQRSIEVEEEQDLYDAPAPALEGPSASNGHHPASASSRARVPPSRHSSSSDITRFFRPSIGRNPFQPSRSPSLPALPPDARPHHPRGIQQGPLRSKVSHRSRTASPGPSNADDSDFDPDDFQLTHMDDDEDDSVPQERIDDEDERVPPEQIDDDENEHVRQEWIDNDENEHVRHEWDRQERESRRSEPLEGPLEGEQSNHGAEESGGEFQSEHFNSEGGSEPEDEEQDPTEYMVQALLDQLQGGFNGCSPSVHAEKVQMHMNDSPDNHHGLDELFPSDPHFPSVLSRGDVLRPEQLRHVDAPSEHQWNSKFCGVVRPPRHRPGQRPRPGPQRVCLHKEQTQEVSPDVAFDIDSFLGFASSICVARQGLWYQPAAQVRQNIKNDIQLGGTAFRPTEAVDPETPPRAYSAMLRDIPHFLLGRVVGAHDITVHILFPHLPFRGDKFVGLTRQQLTQWLDRIFHPSIYDHVPAHYSQHLTASYDQAYANSKAHQVEARLAETASHRAQQTVGYHLQPEYLVDIWESVLERVRQPDLQPFRDPQLFFSAKGTKLQFKTTPSRPTLLDAMDTFQTYLELVLELEFVHRDRLYVDLGKEICPRMAKLRSQQLGLDQEPQVYLWRRCCLEHYLREMYDGRPPSVGAPGQRYYTQNMLRDAGSLTSVTPKRSRRRAGGLVYSQFYSSVKEVWDATKLMPFENDGLEELALDPLILKSVKRAGGGHAGSTTVVRAAYCASKRRAHCSLRDSAQRSFGIREEHRVSWTLFQAIRTRLRAMDPDALELFLSDAPSYVWPVRTATYLDFLWRSADRFASGFEYVHAQSNRELVTWEQTKMMAMFLRCLRYVLGGQGLSRESALWWSRREGRAPTTDPDGAPAGARRTWVGLGFQKTLERYGYAWMESRFDWRRLQFHDGITDLVLFGNSVLRHRYLLRGGRVRDFVSTSHTLEKALTWIPVYQGPEHERVHSQLLDWVVHIILRQFRFDVLTALPPPEIDEELREEALEGISPFTYRFLEQTLVQPIYLTSGNRSIYPTPRHLAYTLFGFHDERKRAHWDHLPFRSLFRSGEHARASTLPSVDTILSTGISVADSGGTYTYGGMHPVVDPKVDSPAKWTRSRPFWDEEDPRPRAISEWSYALLGSVST